MTTPAPTVATLRDVRGILPESLYWDAERRRLVWVDITAGTVHVGRLDAPVDGSRDEVHLIEAPLSAVQPDIDGGMVATLKDSVALLDERFRIVRTIARVQHAHDGIRFNEAKVDPFGALVVGSMDVTAGAADAAVYRVHRDGAVEGLFGGFGVANGLEWAPDGSTMYVTDTSVKTIYRVDYGPGGVAGELEPFHVGADSDGLARACDGGFRNGVYGTGEVLLLDRRGRETGRWPIPAPQVTSVAFAGERFDLMVVATARENLTERELADHPLSGGLFAVTGAGRGRGPSVFGGGHQSVSTPDTDERTREWISG